MSEKSSNKVLLIDEYKEPLKLVESYSTPSGQNSGAVLATLFGTLSDFSEETRNNRWYSGSLWKKVLNDPLFKEAMETKSSFGEADHPMDIENRLETHIPYVSHIVRDVSLNEGKQCVEGFIDVLDTPNGRIVKTLIDYGTTIGVSSRGSGDLTYIDGKTMVDENTYTFVTWDIVARPSNRKARVHEIDTVNDEGRTAFESMQSQIKSMIETHNVSSLKLTESLVSNTDIPDKDKVLGMIREALEVSDDKPHLNDEDNESKDTSDMVPKSDLDDAYDRILELKSENSELDSENKSLKKSLEESENTISDLNGLNKNLSSMVSSYMESITEDDPKNTINKDVTESDEIDSEEDKKNNNESSEEVNFDEVLDAIDQSNDEVMNKLSEMTKFIRQSIKTEDLRQANDKLRSQLTEANNKYSELQTKYKDSLTESTQLKKRNASIVTEYFKLRCSQLGLNESVARKEFNNKLYEYDLKDINEVLNEMYASNQKSTRRSIMNESDNSGSTLGSLVLTGAIRQKGNSEDTNDDDFDNNLVEAIRQVRLG